jgi:hypothetical protein
MTKARIEKSWIAVASAEHVRTGVAAGIMQVCHGKAQPLRRLSAGDRIAYYSPTASFRGGDRLQAFTAVGRVAAGEPYRMDPCGDFSPYRREVLWDEAEAAAIAPLLDELEFTRGRRNWGYQLRFGLFEVEGGDLDRIAAAMRAAPASQLSSASGGRR